MSTTAERLGYLAVGGNPTIGFKVLVVGTQLTGLTERREP
jgi:hypothetical protein